MAPAKAKKSVQEVKIEDIEFQAVEECTCAKICKRYIELLNDDGGHYPELLEACKNKLLKLDKKIYYSLFTTQAKPEDVEEAIKDILSWEEDVRKTDTSLSENVNPSATTKAPIRGNEAAIAPRKVPNQKEDTRKPDKKYARDEQSMEQYYKKWGSVDVENIEKEIDEQDEEKRREFEEMAEKQRANKPTFDYDTPDMDSLPAAQREYLGNAEKAKGNEAFYAKDFEESLAYYSKALAYCPSKPSIWANRALAKLRLNDPVGAEEDCLQALEFDANYMKPWHRLGKALFEQGRYDEAYDAFRKAQRLDPYNQQINTDLMKTKKKVKPKEDHQTTSQTMSRVFIEELSDDETAQPASTTQPMAAAPAVKEAVVDGFTRVHIEEESDSDLDRTEDTMADVRESKNPLDDVNAPAVQTSSPPTSGFTRTHIEEGSDSEEDVKPANTSVAQTSSPPVSGFARMQIEEGSDIEEDVKPVNTSVAQTSSPPASGFTRMQIEEESDGEEECTIKPSPTPVVVPRTNIPTVPAATTTGTANPVFAPPPRQKSAPVAEPTQTYIDGDPYVEAHLFSELTTQAVERAKNQANKLFATGHYSDSVRVFDTILSVLAAHQIPITQAIYSCLYSNRALAYLKLELWEKARLDCSEAIKKNEGNTKAFYRRALALCELGEFSLAAVDIEIVRSRLGDAQVKEIQTKISLGLQRKKMEVKEENEHELRSSPVVMEEAEERNACKTVPAAVASPPSQLVDKDIEVEFRNDDGFVLVNHSSVPGNESSVISNVTPYIDPTISIAPTLEAITDAKNRGNILFSNGEYQKAERTFTKCIYVADTSVPLVLLPDTLRSILYCNCAFALIKQEKWLLAEKECTAALTYNAANIKAIYRRAWARLELDMLEKALEDCNDVARREGDELPKVREIRERIEKAQKLNSDFRGRDFVQVTNANAEDVVEEIVASKKSKVDSNNSGDWVAVRASPSNQASVDNSDAETDPAIQTKANVAANTVSTVVKNEAAATTNTMSSQRTTARKPPTDVFSPHQAPLTTPSTGSTSAQLPSTNDSAALPAKAPRSVFEFDRHLRGLRNADSTSQYLKSLVPPKLLSKLYSNSEMDVDTLALLIEALHRIEDSDTLSAYLASIQKTRNSKISILMLSSSHQQLYKDLCNYK
eukprot:GEMP01004079.1.p1 GENE.GEMP01004079.1~~GEMP01004079.1.p1  ORF type:complete len:1157 (+),score=244.93 GEMP01004079.1:113-3583(+)